MIIISSTAHYREFVGDWLFIIFTCIIHHQPRGQTSKDTSSHIQPVVWLLTLDSIKSDCDDTSILASFGCECSGGDFPASPEDTLFRESFLLIYKGLPEIIVFAVLITVLILDIFFGFFKCSCSPQGYWSVCTERMNCDLADMQPLVVRVLVYVIISFAYNHN